MTKVAIISDSHDNIWNLEKALEDIKESGATMLLHCGDLCAPFIIGQIAQAFAGPIHIIFGNNDGDGRLLQTVASQFDHVSLHGIYIEIEAGNRKLAMIHYPEPAIRIAQSGQFDLVCYGHDHQKFQKQVGDSWLVNPGEVMGRFGEPGWGLYDCETHGYEWREI